ncbi:MAG: Epoxide hydrolase 1 [Geminicoccaceae bacterium]|jgi:pimeloyl-ACP methyl ester carboxylesterase|nr:Epoxide hydrolase 1 [Geminicoccaceae bacterium]
MEPRGHGTFTAISRRAVLQAGAATAIAASGLAPAGSALAHPAITAFSYRAPQSALDDLRERLAQARWPEREPVDDWSQGVPLARLRALVEHWRAGYDWRRCEARLDRLDQYRTAIDGLDIHFVHVRSPHADALPILITHGWPGAVIEFLDVIDPLTDPAAHGGRAEDAFHVIAPSLPGFGFSGKPAERGWNAGRVARAWAELMVRLGYERYVAQGGDWGAVVTTEMARQRPAGLAAIHLNMPLVIPNPVPTEGLSAEEQRAVERYQRFLSDGFGYFLLQATRPQTIGYALTDSPVGQAAWIYEKFQAWTDNHGQPEDALTQDEMLDVITLYWLTETAASSARMYLENAAVTGAPPVIEMPVGCSIFPREIVPAPRRWAERVYPNLIHWNELDRGGHFAAFEQPALFTRELRDCFRSVR